MDADRLLDPATPESDIDRECRELGIDPAYAQARGENVFLRWRCDRLQEELGGKLARQAPLIEALLVTDRQELPHPLAMLVDAYVKGCGNGERD